MEDTQRIPAQQAKAWPISAKDSARAFADRLTGRMAIVVNGKTEAVIDIDAGKGKLVAGGAAGGGTRATMLVRSMAHFDRIARGEVNIVVASLRGDAAVRGDLTFAVNVLRAIASGLPLEGANAKGG